MHRVKQKHLNAGQALAMKENYNYNLCFCPSPSLSPTLRKEGAVAGVEVGWGKEQGQSRDLSPSAGSKPTGLAWERSLNWSKDWNVNLDLQENPKIVLETMDLAQKVRNKVEKSYLQNAW